MVTSSTLDRSSTTYDAGKGRCAELKFGLETKCTNKKQCTVTIGQGTQVSSDPLRRVWKTSPHMYRLRYLLALCPDQQTTAIMCLPAKLDCRQKSGKLCRADLELRVNDQRPPRRIADDCAVFRGNLANQSSFKYEMVLRGTV